MRIYSASWHYSPRVHEYLKEMHDKVLSGMFLLMFSVRHPFPDISSRITEYDTITVGEAPFSHSMADLARFVLPAERELNMVFHFELADIDNGGHNHNVALEYDSWTLPQLRGVIGKWQKFMREEGFWNTLVASSHHIRLVSLLTDKFLDTFSVFIENHDLARSVSRFGNDSPQWRTLSAKMLAIFQVTLGGTLFIYQGQEIAMKNAPRGWGIEEYKDVATVNYYARLVIFIIILFLCVGGS